MRTLQASDASPARAGLPTTSACGTRKPTSTKYLWHKAAEGTRGQRRLRPLRKAHGTSRACQGTVAGDVVKHFHV
jgi:hypothetical protein